MRISQASQVQNCDYRIILIRPFLIRPEILLWRGFSRLWQCRFLAIEGNANVRPEAGVLLEHGRDSAALANELAQPGCALCSEVADLDAASAEDRHSAGICRVRRLWAKLYWLARFAYREFEAAGGAALVGVVGADDGEGKGGEGQGCRGGLFLVSRQGPQSVNGHARPQHTGQANYDPGFRHRIHQVLIIRHERHEQEGREGGPATCLGERVGNVKSTAFCTADNCTNDTKEDR